MKKIKKFSHKDRIQKKQKKSSESFSVSKKKNHLKKKSFGFEHWRNICKKLQLRKKEFTVSHIKDFSSFYLFPLERGLYFDWLNSWQDVTRSLDLMVDE